MRCAASNIFRSSNHCETRQSKSRISVVPLIRPAVWIFYASSTPNERELTHSLAMFVRSKDFTSVSQHLTMRREWINENYWKCRMDMVVAFILLNGCRDAEQET